MVVGGVGAEYDVEVLDLESSEIESNCPKLENCPLKRDSVGTFMNDAAVVCQSSYPDSPDCYFYNMKQG